MALPDTKWYDQANRGELHDDLRTDYSKTLEIVMVRPSLKKHFQDCSICQGIRALHDTPAAPAAGTMAHRELLRRRKMFVMDSGDLARLLQLPPNAGILFLNLSGQRDVLEITVCSPDYEITQYGAEPNAARVQLEAS